MSYYPGISWSDWGRLHKRKSGQSVPLPVLILVTFEICVRSTTILAHLLSSTNYKETITTHVS